MDIYAFNVELKDKETEENTIQGGLILSSSYPKAANSLIVKFRDTYEVGKICLDSLVSGNIKTLDEATMKQLVDIFAHLEEQETEEESTP